MKNLRNYSHRINLITGNIVKDNFNLPDEQYDFLGNNINCVISSAALVKHYGKYERFL